MVSGAFTQDDNESQWINYQVRLQLYNIEKKTQLIMQLAVLRHNGNSR